MKTILLFFILSFITFAANAKTEVMLMVNLNYSKEELAAL